MTAFAVPADGIATVAAIAAVFALIAYRGGIVKNAQTVLILVLAVIYLFIGLSNLLENSGFLRRMDVYESSFMLLGAAVFLLFFYAVDVERESAAHQERVEHERRSSRAMALARDRMVRFLDSIPDPILVITPEKTVAFANRAFKTTLLPEPDCERSLKNLPLSELPTVARSIVARCPLQELSARGEPVTRSLRLPDKGIGGIVYQVNAMPLKSPDGSLTEVFYQVCDITPESRMLDATFLERRSRSVLTVVSRVTHEINNILGGIGGVAQLLRTGDFPPDEVADYMGKVSELVGRGTKLISDLSGIPDGKTSHATTPLAELIPRVEKTLTEVLPPGIRLRVAVAENLHPVEVDPDEMKVAVCNLAMNAAEASLPGGTVVIEAENVQLGPDNLPAHCATDERDFVRIAVVDSGRGIHSDEQQRVFEPFFTTKGMHKGMGLPVASLIAERHQGFLRLEKSDELGSVFAVYLPALAKADSVATIEDTAPEEDAPDLNVPSEPFGQ